jgi:hypothetical protein
LEHTAGDVRNTTNATISTKPFIYAHGGQPMSAPGHFLLYTAPDGAVKVDVFIQQETVWLTQKALAELFGVKVPAVNKHLKNIFESGELREDSVISILETTAADGKNYSTRYYNLDAIIAVGYRVNSHQGHAVPHLGHEDAAGVLHQGFRAG